MTNQRVYNFSAGPSTLPISVLQKIADDIPNYKGSGMSVMEMSHRSSSYLEIFNETKKRLKELMDIPDQYQILFLQGGATQQFSTIPLNLMKNQRADYIVTGAFAKKAAQEAQKFGDVHIAYDGSKHRFRHIPTQEELHLRQDASYVHLCSNNTIYGTEWKYVPDTQGIPLVADMSSNILSRPIQVSDYGMIYAGTQKNMGIAGLGVVIVREDLIATHRDKIPVLMEYDTLAQHDSMYNTPPTFSIYVLNLMLQWIESLGGLIAMEKRNEEKAQILYDYLDHSDFYHAHSERENRSLMNVTFTCPTPELDAQFVQEAARNGMVNLKGHRSVGGIRASIYNAMPQDGVESLVALMEKFEKENRQVIECIE